MYTYTLYGILTIMIICLTIGTIIGFFGLYKLLDSKTIKLKDIKDFIYDYEEEPLR